METTEKIVEAYARYVKRWATIPNIKCDGQFEIDLLAIDPIRLERYHIESGISDSGSYSALTDKPFDPADLKIRVKIAGTRRTLGYSIERKFGSPNVTARLAKQVRTVAPRSQPPSAKGSSDGPDRTAGAEIRKFERKADLPDRLPDVH